MRFSKLASTGACLPTRVVTNADLEKIWDTSDEWIQQRSGISERRWVEPGKDTTLSLGLGAAQDAMKKANVGIDDIDAIIFGCLVSDFIFPGTGVLLQQALGCKRNIPALDIRNQCSGFLYAVSVADAWIRSGMYKRVLIVASEIHSTSLDYGPEGRNIGVLFGDGAGAAILEATEDENHRVVETIIHSQGEYADRLSLQKPSSNDFPRLGPKTADEPLAFPNMDGKMVFKNAVTRMPEITRTILKKHNLTSEDVDFVIAHQANARINAMVMQQLELPESKTHNTLQKYGNTTMATIPITLDEAWSEGKVKAGDNIILVAFGSGFTWGSTLLRL